MNLYNLMFIISKWVCQLITCIVVVVVVVVVIVVVIVVLVVAVVVGQTVGSISSKTLVYDCLYTIELCTASMISTS